jgi:hypothetical protein
MSVPIFTQIISVIRWTVAITIPAAAWLLKEDEEGRITNWLEEKRKAVAAKRDQTLSETTIYLQSLASIISGLFSKVFGKRLLSVQAVFISLLLSSISIVAIVLVSEAIHPDYEYTIVDGARAPLYEQERRKLVTIGLINVLLIICAVVCVRYSSSKILKTIQYLFFVVVFIVALYAGLLCIRDRSAMFRYSMYVLGVSLSIGMDMSFVLTMRWMFGKIDKASNLKAITFISLSNVLILALIVSITFAFPLYAWHLGKYRPPIPFEHIGVATSIAGASCVLDAFLSSLILVVCIGISLNSLVWPFVERNIYSFNRHKILANKKLMWSGGIAMCGEPHIWNLVVKAVRAGWF